MEILKNKSPAIITALFTDTVGIPLQCYYAVGDMPTAADFEIVPWVALLALIEIRFWVRYYRR